ncbi:MAG: DPP IV N-terminal domain-containing protein [Bacteroidales bacterium]|nr:DPP IV N-terminal domain-containing protein [Bacteroidales bacterium]
MKRLILLFAAGFIALSALAQETNPTYSPDSSFVAYTSGGDLFVRPASGGEAIRLTQDGSDVILNGYASWVYYEEIFGRPSRYRAFWWSPDSRKLAFYRFDNTVVKMFPIYSPYGGKGGSLSETRYPLAGDPNPNVRVGIVSLDEPSKIIWADFDETVDQYFGTPFWGADSRQLFVQREPRVQQELELFAVDATDGSKKSIYRETYPTWLDWMQDMLFTRDGLYMARAFETGWQQIYFLSYDGKTLKRLTSGVNWRISLLAVDEKAGTVYFTSYRDSDVHPCLYSVDRRGRIKLLSDPDYAVSVQSLDLNMKKAEVLYSNINTDWMPYSIDLRKALSTPKEDSRSQSAMTGNEVPDGPQFEIVYAEMADGQKVPAAVALPRDFDPSKKYPVVMEIYGGPDNPYVRDSKRRASPMVRWFWETGVIRAIIDTRAAGHTGRKGTDLVYRDVVSVPVQDACAWARWFGALPYVDATRIGIEGFSFGGTMTAMLVMNHPDLFRCGIAGGGVYDWELYDTHYTERFMDTPQRNPEGYAKARALNYVRNYDPSRSRLKLTHGTGDDNVHLQNTLLLVDSLQRNGKQFDLMLYPDGMHGYRGKQSLHDNEADREFWSRYLLNP